MKHYLIPTDFTVESLKAVQAVISAYGNNRMKITLFHLLDMSNDTIELLFRSTRSKNRDLVNEDFKESCEILMNMHQSKIESMQVRFGYGRTKAYLKHLLDGLKIDRIVVCPDITLGLPSKDSVDMLPLLEKTGVPIDIIPAKMIGRIYKNINTINVLRENEVKTPKTVKDYVTQK